jgi:2-desacetyl-2-hydroxyethyl bacteriochlorophyllide A dehydrogenase
VRAAVLEAFGEPLTIAEDVAEPAPGAHEVLVRTRAAGICRTDLKVIDGVIPTVELPRIPGHEIAGEVVAIGSAVTTSSVGDRVLVVLDLSCGTCRYCRVGQLDHCAALRRLGMEQDGGLAEFVRVPAGNLIVLPDRMGFADAAVIPDAVGSPYHAVVRLAQVRPAQTVAIYGLGGLGLSAVQIAALCGASVIAIARTPERRAMAEELGASASIDPNAGPVADQVRDLTRGEGVHAFFDLVGIDGSAEQALAACRKGGSVVILGYSVPRLDAPMVRLVYDEINIRGSRGSTREDLHQVVDLVEKGALAPIIGEQGPLDEINPALDRLRAGAVIGRSVVAFP